jgi:hypothetical protein
MVSFIDHYTYSLIIVRQLTVNTNFAQFSINVKVCFLLLSQVCWAIQQAGEFSWKLLLTVFLRCEKIKRCEKRPNLIV